jgi:hypothetical protein
MIQVFDHPALQIEYANRCHKKLPTLELGCIENEFSSFDRLRMSGLYTLHDEQDIPCLVSGACPEFIEGNLERNSYFFLPASPGQQLLFRDGGYF